MPLLFINRKHENRKWKKEWKKKENDQGKEIWFGTSDKAATRLALKLMKCVSRKTLDELIESNIGNGIRVCTTTFVQW